MQDCQIHFEPGWDESEYYRDKGWQLLNLKNGADVTNRINFIFPGPQIIAFRPLLNILSEHGATGLQEGGWESIMFRY